MRIPKPWSGSTPMAAAFNQLRQYVLENTLLKGRGYRRQPAANGFFLELESSAGGSSSPVDAMHFRGLWVQNPTAPYMAQDEVKIDVGVAKGTYVSTIDNNPNDPATGIGWTQTAKSDTIGNWS